MSLELTSVNFHTVSQCSWLLAIQKIILIIIISSHLLFSNYAMLHGLASVCRDLHFQNKPKRDYELKSSLFFPRYYGVVTLVSIFQVVNWIHTAKRCLWNERQCCYAAIFVEYYIMGHFDFVCRVKISQEKVIIFCVQILSSWEIVIFWGKTPYWGSLKIQFIHI